VNHPTAVQTAGRIGPLVGGVGCLLVVGTVCAWLVYATYDLGNSLWQVYLLKSRGQPAVAHVTGYTPEKRWAGGRHRPNIQVHFHTAEFNGLSGKVRLPQEIPIGTEIRVLYLPEAPEVVTAGERHDSFMTLLHGRAMSGTAWDGMMCSVGVVLLLLKLVMVGGIEQLERWCRKLIPR
jgi:Protein of unknown function (DUF3592)